MTFRPINTPDAAAPGGHYSQAFVSGDLVFVSGLLPIEPGGSPEAGRDFRTQADCVLRNAVAVLTAAGSSLADIVKTTVYIVDIANWAEFNTIYASYLGEHRPARAVVPVPQLHYGFALEVEFVARLTPTS